LYRIDARSASLALRRGTIRLEVATMNAIRIRKRIDSETLTLPELRPMIGETVEIIVLEVEPTPVAEQSGATAYDSLFELAGEGAVDSEACRNLRERERRLPS